MPRPRPGRGSPTPTRAASVAWELGLLDEALAVHRRSLELVEPMASAVPGDPEARAALGRAHTRIGFTLRTMGRPAEALASYEKARAIQDALARDDPSDDRRREHLFNRQRDLRPRQGPEKMKDRLGQATDEVGRAPAFPAS